MHSLGLLRVWDKDCQALQVGLWKAPPMGVPTSAVGTRGLQLLGSGFSVRACAGHDGVAALHGPVQGTTFCSTDCFGSGSQRLVSATGCKHVLRVLFCG